MELKCCPCCGDEANYRTENFGAKVWVQCMGCGLQTSRYEVDEIVCSKSGKEWAAMTWNRRAYNV